MCDDEQRPSVPEGGAVERPTGLDNLATPVVVVDALRLRRNLRAMQSKADSRGVALRPHIKTHKSVEIARKQLDLGAIGITASKPDEARCFAQAGISSITLAYPVIDARRLDALLEATRGGDLRTIADSDEGVSALAQAAAAHSRRLPVYMKVDVGLGRVGVVPGSRRALDLARRIASTNQLEFRGLLSHAGHAYAAVDAEGVRDVARQERTLLGDLARRLHDQAGLAVPELSVGCTPTALACYDELDGLSEMRPGNYAFLDRMAIAQGLASWDDLALYVLATVVSVNDHYAIVDAGSKVLSSDGGPHGSDRLRGFGAAILPNVSDSAPSGEPLLVEKLSEEHGFVALPRHGTSPQSDRGTIRLGDRLRLYPNHSCPVVNLADRVALLDDRSGSVRWLGIDARGQVQ